MGLFSFFKKGKSLDELYDELCKKAYNADIKDDDISLLDEREKVFFVLYTFHLELDNGGIKQFFENSSRVYAPLISEYLEIVKATKHKRLFDEFVSSNNLDLYDSTKWVDTVIMDVYDTFDDEFYKLSELEVHLEVYIENM